MPGLAGNLQVDPVFFCVGIGNRLDLCDLGFVALGSEQMGKPFLSLQVLVNRLTLDLLGLFQFSVNKFIVDPQTTVDRHLGKLDRPRSIKSPSSVQQGV